ncbi:MAG: ABC transporter permease [Bacteroidaceae bacterium]|nr:ABC transporter permease [Bacteroidaceae bacterium]MBR1903103.1 ABC transporter permease [Bacteroidaceae bacterium]
MFTWFIASRLFRHSDDVKRVSKPAIRIATLGVAVGVAIMLLSTGVVLAFQSEIRNKVLGFGSHIQVINYDSQNSEQYKPIVFNTETFSLLDSVPGAQTISPFCIKPGMLKTDNTFRGVMFKGVGERYDYSFFRKHLVEGEITSFPDTSATGKLIISQSLSKQMSLKVGADVYAYFFEDKVKARKFKVSAIYCTNLTDFDNKLVFTDVSTVQKLLGFDTYQYSGAEIWLNDFTQLPEASSYIINNVNRTQDPYGAYYTSMSIYEMYPQIFAWLQLLNLDVWVILILMVCVAGVTMISGLLIIILERTNFIGILKALGASNARMRHIFLYFSFFVILRGLIYGNVLAFAIIFIQQQWHLIHLDPSVYYVEAVPVTINWLYFAIINVATLLICVLALVIPSYLISNIHPAKSIRFE